MTPPDELMDLILVPSILGTPWSVFRGYPPAVQMLTRHLLMRHIAGGHALNSQVIRHE